MKSEMREREMRRQEPLHTLSLELPTTDIIIPNLSIYLSTNKPLAAYDLLCAYVELHILVVLHKMKLLKRKTDAEHKKKRRRNASLLSYRKEERASRQRK